ncbi:solute carrier family 25 member 38 [Cyberlindnera jadinii NRRL Y-1542]|uniref:Mitochondrial glycine transporter n=1 Tax=Cyberlindnera jadinii (strain ATCC 18201 / CBS 1600 / BCRC 20928 / JCM 3617 / NBRC 0987 / NRRL Y-1542) TaxID=983966 RepID=A0A1E4S3X7_CYBJN|nr:solute carrier family 25 member 38 [Cyberlindnera jadinii NRRL Y-1542]XP_020071151.1 solute carrier family 25 member 38 [Cyberlindnera jadinii NRRL Y-1542]ODV70862.1 solute carrier family 25 member 38 [Cyberlindnera jadinii NRRL Y-1542]ODV74112.1 solute carrier family 25 member 38 [Cyberlindnera jadinii NRRL Y-1542]
MSEKPISHLIGGFAGGLTSAVILQPFDLVKTRLQQQPSGSIPDTLRTLSSYKELWRGTLPSAVRTSVGSALYLTSLHAFRSVLAKSHNSSATNVSGSSSSLPKLSMAENLVTGGLTRGFVGFVTMPITVLKVRYESTVYQYDSLLGAVRSIHQTEGVKGFFRGFTATCMRDAPYAGLYVLFYEQCKMVLPKMLPNVDTGTTLSVSKSAMINSLSAFSAASIATTITGPFDTIKTRMQLKPLEFTGFWQAGVKIVREEGAIRLFDGLSLRLTRKAFSAGIAWGIYEEIIKYIVRQH